MDRMLFALWCMFLLDLGKNFLLETLEMNRLANLRDEDEDTYSIA